jgi:uncharacterized protein YutE (UPF0331/DUF86 family)
MRRALVASQLAELATITTELAKRRGVSAEELARDLSARWVVERGILAGAGVVLDVADHLLSAHFGVYVETYEESLRELGRRSIVSPALDARLHGLGQVRNVLAHEYVKVDLTLLVQHLERALEVFPAFASEVAAWLNEVTDSEG